MEESKEQKMAGGIVDGTGAGRLTLYIPDGTVQFHGERGELLVTVRRDGTVTVYKEGAESEAAQRFWGAVSQAAPARLHYPLETRALLEMIRDEAARLRGAPDAALSEAWRFSRTETFALLQALSLALGIPAE